MGNFNSHLVKALDNYPYDMEVCLESLQYALSSDFQNALALCLMGRIYAEQLYQYEEAKNCYQEAMTQDMQLVELYPHYAYTLIQNEDFKEAEKLIDFAFTIKGINKGDMWCYRIMLAEKNKDYSKALEFISEAICEGYNSSFISNIEDIEKRIKKKKDLKKKESNSEKKKKSKKKTK